MEIVMRKSNSRAGFDGMVQIRRHASAALASPFFRNPVTWTLAALLVSVVGLYIDLR
jgi:hypothetical protein